METQSAFYEAESKILHPVKVNVMLRMVNVQICHSRAALCYAIAINGMKGAW
jgi:hypothetical protein